MTVSGLDCLAAGAPLEISITPGSRRPIKAIADLHTNEEVEVLKQGGVPRLLTAQMGQDD